MYFHEYSFGIDFARTENFIFGHDSVSLMFNGKGYELFVQTPGNTGGVISREICVDEGIEEIVDIIIKFCKNELWG